MAVSVRCIDLRLAILLTCTMLASAVALPAPGLSDAKQGCHATRPTHPSGASLRPSEPARQGRFEFSEKFNPKTYERKDYVKGPGNKKPVLFYEHGRSIAPAMSHSGRLVLINDYFATKGCRIMISDLQTHTVWNISPQTIANYEQSAKPDPRLIIVPEAYGFSLSDRRVLIGMDLIYISVPTAEMASRLKRSYRKWWYVVDSSSGHILHV